jgi:hypothetical protein
MTPELLISILLGIVAFVGALGVKQLMSIAKSVNEIKVELGVIVTKQAHMEKQQDEIEHRVLILERKK